jgi:tRNA uridine 5-carboxymethylaminomethyl modification enzyme
MGKATDLATLQFRMLNRSKGPAVWAPRAQCDRGLYRRAVRSLVEEQHGVHTIQGTVARLIMNGSSRVEGLETLEGRRFAARAIVITAGTFLRGRMHIGTTTHVSGGRAGESATVDLAEQLEGAGLTVCRFKTGTPPRIDGRSVDYSSLSRQESEIEDFDYSWSHFWNQPRRDGIATRHPPQLPCWITWLEAEGKEIIEANIASSAMYGGAISSRGPRYCPSVEDKIVKFPNAERHQIFLEPEGHDTNELYVNGLSTSLPVSVQLEILRSIPGLENVRMTRAGYAVEYDYYPPTQLDPSLQVKSISGLFFGGQINGTTGYEEAAGQGLIAGMNAALFTSDRTPVILGRESSYIGVLIDDLVTKGVDEPYRLFTSRSEFRLTVRQDNALRRLADRGIALGIYDDNERSVIETRVNEETSLRSFVDSTNVAPGDARKYLDEVSSSQLSEPVRIVELVRRPEVRLSSLLNAIDADQAVSRDVLLSTELEIKYAGYFDRERLQAERLRQMGDFKLDATLDYESMQSLSFEARQKLSAVQPRTLGQASQIPGVSPSDLQNLVIEVERRRLDPSDSVQPVGS